MPDATAKVIEIPEIELGRLLVTIEGQTPLITHRFGERSRAAIEGKQQGAARTAKPPRDSEAEFQDGLYVIGDGRHGAG